MIINEKQLLKLALLHKEYQTVAYIMIGYYAGYVEGMIEDYKDKFNILFADLPIEALKVMKEQNASTAMFKHLDILLDKRIDRLFLMSERIGQ